MKKPCFQTKAFSVHPPHVSTKPSGQTPLALHSLAKSSGTGGRAGGGGAEGRGQETACQRKPSARSWEAQPSPRTVPTPRFPPGPSLSPVRAATLEWSRDQGGGSGWRTHPGEGRLRCQGERPRSGEGGGGGKRGKWAGGDTPPRRSRGGGGERGRWRRKGRFADGRGGLAGGRGEEAAREGRGPRRGREGAVRRGLAGGGRAPGARSLWAQGLQQPGQQRRPRPPSPVRSAQRPPRRLGFGRLGTAPARAPFGGPGERRRRPAAL